MLNDLGGLKTLDSSVIARRIEQNLNNLAPRTEWQENNNFSFKSLAAVHRLLKKNINFSRHESRLKRIFSKQTNIMTFADLPKDDDEKHKITHKASPSSLESNKCSDESTSSKSSSAEPAVPLIPAPRELFFKKSQLSPFWSGQRAPPRCGIKNKGNTCYAASILQCLAHCASFWNWITGEEDKRFCQDTQNCSICALKHDFISMLYKGEACIPAYPAKIFNIINDLCDSDNQEDAHEFLRVLIDRLQTDYFERHLRRPIRSIDLFSQATSPIGAIFGGYIRTSTRCLTCHNRSDCYEAFNDLMVDIPIHFRARPNVTLRDVLNESLFRSETLDDKKNLYFCERCNSKTIAKRTVKFHEVPDTLTIQLKRYSTSFGHAFSKVNTPIKPDELIDLSHHMADTSEEFKRASKVIYKLTGCVTHKFSDSISSGHYISSCRNHAEQWLQFDDAYVEMRSRASLSNDFNSGYIFFYRRVRATQVSHEVEQIKRALPLSRRESSPKRIKLDRENGKGSEKREVSASGLLQEYRERKAEGDSRSGRFNLHSGGGKDWLQKNRERNENKFSSNGYRFNSGSERIYKHGHNGYNRYNGSKNHRHRPSHVQFKDHKYQRHHSYRSSSSKSSSYASHNNRHKFR